MNFIFFTTLFAERSVNALCWTLFHSLWQGLLFAIVAGLVMIFTRASTAVLRYKILSVLFFGVTFSFTITFLYELQSSRTADSLPNFANYQIKIGSPVFLHPVNIPEKGKSSISIAVGNFLSSNASLIVAVWILILCAKSVRMAFVLGYTRHITRHKTQSPPEFWKMR